VVLDGGDPRRHTDLEAPEIDDSIPLLVTAAAEARRDPAVVIPPARRRLMLEKLSLGLLLGELGEVAHPVEAASRTRRLERLDCHGGLNLRFRRIRCGRPP